MIGLRDTATLALTKLRTRKVRLAITVVVSGLLFSALAGASLVARGAFASIDTFSKEGFGSRYVVQAMAQQDSGFFQSPDVMARALELYNDIIARKKVEAKRLGIEYDPKTEPSPVSEYDTPEGKQKSLNFNDPSAQQAIKEYIESHQSGSFDDLKKVAKTYGATSFYQDKGFSYATDGSSVQVLKDGKETYGTQNQKGAYGPPTGTDSFIQSWTLMSGELLRPFILPGATLGVTKDATIPVIVPYSAAEQLLGLKALPGSASPADKLERTKEVRQKAKQASFEVCFRSSESAALIGAALSVQQEIEQNKKNTDYVRPSLIYGLPDQPCGTSPVIRDVRTYSEKVAAAKQAEFDAVFGKKDPTQQILKFRVVGVVPDPSYAVATGVSQIISGLVTSSLGNGWYTPLEFKQSNQLLGQLFADDVFSFGPPSYYYAEFSTAAEARKFIDKENCQPDYSAGKDPAAACVAAGKPFMLTAFGSNSLALESAKRNFGKFFTLGAIAIALIGAVIMMGTVGRMIADSRRETAVFRAIGAKKLDIAQVYILYVILISLLIFVFSLCVGFIAASVMQSRYSARVTVQALVAYNAHDLDKTFNLYTFYPLDMLYLLGLSLAAGVVSAIFPLFRNLRRNPIRDMRDDT